MCLFLVGAMCLSGVVCAHDDAGLAPACKIHAGWDTLDFSSVVDSPFSVAYEHLDSNHDWFENYYLIFCVHKDDDIEFSMGLTQILEGANPTPAPTPKHMFKWDTSAKLSRSGNLLQKGNIFKASFQNGDDCNGAPIKTDLVMTCGDGPAALAVEDYTSAGGGYDPCAYQVTLDLPKDFCINYVTPNLARIVFVFILGLAALCCACGACLVVMYKFKKRIDAQQGGAFVRFPPDEA